MDRGGRILPLPGCANGADSGFFSTVKGLATRIVSKKEVNTHKGIWRHPAKGTGQICEKLADEIVKAGAQIHYKAQVTHMTCVSDGGCERGTGTQRIDSVMAQVGPETISFKPSNVISSIPPGLLKRFLYSQKVSQTVPLCWECASALWYCYLFKRGATVSACLVTGDVPSCKNRPNHELCGF